MFLYCAARSETVRVRWVNDYEPPLPIAVKPFDDLGIDSFVSETVTTNDQLISFVDC